MAKAIADPRFLADRLRPLRRCCGLAARVLSPTSRFTRSVSLAVYLIAALNLPLPYWHDPKNGDQPFPCQNHPCGCQNALQCWTNCCCNTPAQRVLWARENGVEIPSYAVLPTTEELNEAVGAAIAPSTRSCCSRKNNRETAVLPKADHDCHHGAESAPTNKKQPGYVLGLFAAKCSGLDITWIVASWSTLPTAIHTWTHCFDSFTRLQTGTTILTSRADIPPVPPPRSVLRLHA